MLLPVGRGTVAAMLLASALALAGCGGDDDGSGDERVDQADQADLVVYSSLPYAGAAREDAEGIERGIRLALDEHRGRAGEFSLRYEPLDSAGPGGDQPWDPRRVEANARRAADDRATIGYIGELHSGATAVALPILAGAGVPTVGPTNTAVGLTVDEASAAPGEPDRYYPGGRRTYVRVVPRDTVQGEALARLMRGARCRRAFIVHDGTYYGRGLARTTAEAANQAGITVADTVEANRRAPGDRTLARRAQRSRATCALFAGQVHSEAVRVVEDLARALPGASLFGGDGVAVTAFTDPQHGGLDPEVARRVMVTLPTLPPSFYPPRGQRFFRAYARRHGAPPNAYAIYGYEAMNLLIDAIRAAGPRGDDRAAVTDQLFLVEDREGAIGRYDIDENGDTTLREYGAYRIAGGRLRFEQLLSPSQ